MLNNKPKTILKSVVLAGVSLLFALFIVEIVIGLVPGLIPDVVRIYFGDENLEKWGLRGDRELGLKYAPDLIDFATPFGDDAGRQSSYLVSTTSLDYDGIGFRDDGLEGEPFAVVVGDSFASCAGVKMEECWVELLEQDSGRDFANLGVITYGPQQTQRMLAGYGLPLKPKLVLWVFFANDPDDAWRFDHFGKVEAREARVWQNPIQSWLLKHSKAYLILAFCWYNRRFLYNLATETERDISIDGDLIWWETVTNLSNPDALESIDLAQKSILEAKRQSDLQGAEFIVVVMPAREQIYSRSPVLQAQLDAFNELFVDFGRRHDLKVIDISAEIKERIRTEPSIYFKHDIHLNVRGNRIVAELLEAHLKGVMAQ